MSCIGNSSEYCGGANRLNLYYQNGTVPTIDLYGPNVVSSAGGFSSIGCYTEGTSQRALTSLFIANSNMTVEQCAASCAGYTYFGVEYSQQCFCGFSLSAGSVPASDGCTMTCAGKSSEYCGGSNRLNMYQLNSTSSPSVPGAPNVVPSADGYSFVGCYTELPTGRILSALSAANDNMTVELCSQTCAGYIYFGVEYGRECYCGNNLASGSQPSMNGGCTKSCAGNATELCGGSDRIDLYMLNSSATAPSSTTPSPSSTPMTVPGAGLFKSIGCYTEVTSSRALATLESANSNMTVEQCADFCSAYQYMGVEYADEVRVLTRC